MVANFICENVRYYLSLSFKNPKYWNDGSQTCSLETLT
jgi:hypothetical protein